MEAGAQVFYRQNLLRGNIIKAAKVLNVDGDTALISIQHRDFSGQAQLPLIFALIPLVTRAQMDIRVLSGNFEL